VQETVKVGRQTWQTVRRSSADGSSSYLVSDEVDAGECAAAREQHVAHADVRHLDWAGDRLRARIGWEAIAYVYELPSVKVKPPSRHAFAARLARVHVLAQRRLALRAVCGPCGAQCRARAGIAASVVEEAVVYLALRDGQQDAA
jgi:hypothetical protein